ncbi:DUF6527 family protein [Methylobrevis pamukkalensis]|uniref:Ammonia monooxygenase n=1 Tax=Methylobrevis pamukkalensis TaxID=1439726 RepID=A0A1E3GZX5_9HYPH|nr:DUF6527 family protein [Methylobrevis pamukkalensis]ODN69584.1 hypothetical protein A6302_03130 [Methylobrevis pamukkalensis]
MAARGLLRTAEGGRLLFWCPGCTCAHGVGVGEGSGPRWGFNGDYDAPTFSPSILVTYNGADAGKDGAPQAVCHSFVRSGQIEFLNDCSHDLAGQTVRLKPFGEG